MTTEEKLRKIVAEQLGIAECEVQLQSRLEEDLGADSLDRVELALTIQGDTDEGGLALTLSDEEMHSGAATFSDLLKIVEVKLESES